MVRPSVLMAFLAYVILNVTSYFLIPFIIDYLHNVINGLFIPQSFSLKMADPGKICDLSYWLKQRLS